MKRLAKSILIFLFIANFSIGYAQDNCEDVKVTTSRSAPIPDGNLQETFWLDNGDVLMLWVDKKELNVVKFSSDFSSFQEKQFDLKHKAAPGVWVFNKVILLDDELLVFSSTIKGFEQRSVIQQFVQKIDPESLTLDGEIKHIGSVAPGRWAMKYNSKFIYKKGWNVFLWERMQRVENSSNFVKVLTFFDEELNVVREVKIPRNGAIDIDIKKVGISDDRNILIYYKVLQVSESHKKSKSINKHFVLQNIQGKIRFQQVVFPSKEIIDLDFIFDSNNKQVTVGFYRNPDKEFNGSFFATANDEELIADVVFTDFNSSTKIYELEEYKKYDENAPVGHSFHINKLQLTEDGVVCWAERRWFSRSTDSRGYIRELYKKAEILIRDYDWDGEVSSDVLIPKWQTHARPHLSMGGFKSYMDDNERKLLFVDHVDNLNDENVERVSKAFFAKKNAVINVSTVSDDGTVDQCSAIDVIAAGYTPSALLQNGVWLNSGKDFQMPYWGNKVVFIMQLHFK